MESDLKIGDWVYCHTGISEDNNGPQTGEVYQVKSVSYSAIGIALPNLKLPNFYGEEIINGTMPNWGRSAFTKIDSSNIKTMKLLYNKIEC